MKKLNVRFERDETLDDIDIVIRASEKDSEIDSLITRLTQNNRQQLSVFDRNGCTCVIYDSDIVTVTSDGKQVRVITANGAYGAKQTLQNVEELLTGGAFLRISRFEIVNLMKIRKYDFTIGGTLRIEFEGGMETWASRRYIPLIKKKLSGEEGYLC